LSGWLIRKANEFMKELTELYGDGLQLRTVMTFNSASFADQTATPRETPS
jgi:hypothetical protein